MSPLKKYLNRIEQFDQLIRARRTGPPEVIAYRLQVSIRTFHCFKNELIEDFGFPIAYDPLRQTYVYTRLGKFTGLAFRLDEAANQLVA